MRGAGQGASRPGPIWAWRQVGVALCRVDGRTLVGAVEIWCSAPDLSGEAGRGAAAPFARPRRGPSPRLDA